MYVCHDDMNYRLYTQNIIITQKLKTFNEIFNSNSNIPQLIVKLQNIVMDLTEII